MFAVLFMQRNIKYTKGQNNFFKSNIINIGFRYVIFYLFLFKKDLTRKKCKKGRYLKRKNINNMNQMIQTQNIFSIVVASHLQVHQIDVKSTFPNWLVGERERNLYEAIKDYGQIGGKHLM